MKTRFVSLLCAAVLAAACCPIPAQAADSPALLDVSAFTVRDENLVYIGADYLNPVSVLFNDQDKVPASPDNTSVDKELWSATDRSRNWKPNLQSEFGEDSFYIDLGANYVITGVCFLDNNGVQDWVIEDGEPFAWEKIGGFTTDAYQVWRGVSIEKTRATRWLRFSTPCGDSGVAELALYGYKESELTDAQKEKTAAHPAEITPSNLSAAQIIGFNAFIDDPMTAIMAGGNVREYHNFSWLYDDEGRVKFTQGTWGDMDSFYAAMKARDISIIPCFQGGSSYISGEKPPEIAVPKGADTTDPASYALHAQALYQVAARYGSNTDVDPSTLNVADGSEPKVGMGLLDAAENSNEPNKTWSGKANFFSPYELAAMCSADYDGHEGTIKNAGVKQADPNFRLAMGGMLNTASLIDYLEEMKLWFNYHRSDGKFAVDIINVHMGPDTYNPEDSGFTDRIRELKSWIAKNAPGAELWISEFEIPMDDCETEGVDNHDNETYQLKYAQRVARTYLAALGAGVDRMTKFQLRDEGEGVYYNSGLTTGKGEWSKKLAWYYTACMTNVLKDCYFAADMSTGDGVMQYFFINRKTGESVLCYWLPTNEGKVIKDYQVQMPGPTNAYLTVPGEYAEGTVTALPGDMRSVSIEVSETPVFVTISAEKKPVINGKGRYITPALLCLNADGSGETCDLSAAPEDSKLNQFYRMFDEPDSMPEYIYSDTAGLKTPETNVNSSNITCYVTLPEACVLTGFGLYDTYGTGSFEVYDANTDTLLWSSDLGSYMSRSISLTDDSAPTDRLKIVKGGGDLNEFAIYGYPAPETEEPQNLRGDTDCSGIVNVADAVLLARFCAEDNEITVTAQGKRNADCNDDGSLTAEDIGRLLEFLAGLIPQNEF